ncbi:MASE1 domain-containing protein [Maridesulfovibrio frigidus]|uniref:MASE1 domain-containing protein n=1 Tax=Maridesulfovibrio frigidus TaxID=340956 RepID=UPI0004E1B7D2|nr:MASE1 domain-containing protein [Maridesulfovibrio frigidus]
MVGILKFVCENGAVALGYWFITYLNWLLFSSVGIMPMPIWPAAALALIVALYRGWSVAVGIAVGVVLADYFTLGVALKLAASISVANTLGPVLGAILIKKRISRELKIKSLRDFIIVFLIGLIFVPFVASLGGIGSLLFFGELSSGMALSFMVRWGMAHSLGTLLFALPYLIWAESRRLV